MDIQTESPNSTSSVSAVDAVVPADPNERPTTLTQDLEKAGDYPAEIKPLTGMEAIGTPQMPKILATANTKAAEVQAQRTAPQEPGRLHKFLGALGLRASVTTETVTPSATPDHLTSTPNGTLETPPINNLNGATAEGPAVTKFGNATVSATTETNYAGLSTPDATAVGAATGVPFQNSIASPENAGVAIPAPTEVVASDTPSLGTSQPEVVQQPAQAVTPEPAAATTLAQDMETAGEHPAVLQTEEPETPVVFTPSAETTPAEDESVLPDAPVAAMPVEGLEDPNQTVEAPIEEPEATLAVETETEERSAEEPASLGQSADANSEPVQAGPGASPDGTVAATDWSVNADVHPDAPVVSGNAAVDGDALGKAMADGAAAAADRPPFSTAALAEPTVQKAEVGHDIPIETGSETKTVGEITDDSMAAANDTDIEPTAPTVAAPGGMTPTDPNLPTPIREGVDVVAATGAGMVNDAASLNAGLPNAEAQSVFEVVPNSSEVNNVTAFPRTNTQPTTPELASNDSSLVNATVETPANVTAFPAAAPLAPTGTDGTTQTS